MSTGTLLMRFEARPVDAYHFGDASAPSDHDAPGASTRATPDGNGYFVVHYDAITPTPNDIF